MCKQFLPLGEKKKKDTELLSLVIFSLLCLGCLRKMVLLPSPKGRTLFASQWLLCTLLYCQLVTLSVFEQHKLKASSLVIPTKMVAVLEHTLSLGKPYQKLHTAFINLNQNKVASM
ncbi:UNVERIFIED_CONTAM: hypothetical protein K2H54_016523 [Gekko kuhli]